MSYTPNVPLATQTIAATQGPIQSNFNAVQTFWENNHGDINTGNEGKHKFVSLFEQSPTPATASNEAALFTEEESGVTRLKIRQEGNGQTITLSGPDVVSNFSAGSSFLPALGKGMVFKMGNGIYAGPAASTFNISVAGQAFNGTNWGVVGMIRNDISNAFVIRTTPINSTQFEVRTSAAITGVNVQYLAWGLQP